MFTHSASCPTSNFQLGGLVGRRDPAPRDRGNPLRVLHRRDVALRHRDEFEPLVEPPVGGGEEAVVCDYDLRRHFEVVQPFEDVGMAEFVDRRLQTWRALEFDLAALDLTQAVLEVAVESPRCES